MKRKLSDEEALKRIHEILDGREWNRADDLESIAEIIIGTGREIREPQICPGCDNYIEPREETLEERGETWHEKCLIDYHSCGDPECETCHG